MQSKEMVETVSERIADIMARFITAAVAYRYATDNIGSTEGQGAYRIMQNAMEEMCNLLKSSSIYGPVYVDSLKKMDSIMKGAESTEGN